MLKLHPLHSIRGCAKLLNLEKCWSIVAFSPCTQWGRVLVSCVRVLPLGRKKARQQLEINDQPPFTHSSPLCEFGSGGVRVRSSHPGGESSL